MQLKLSPQLSKCIPANISHILLLSNLFKPRTHSTAVPQSLSLPGCSIQVCSAGAALGAAGSPILFCAGMDRQGSGGLLKAVHKVQGSISTEHLHPLSQKQQHSSDISALVGRAGSWGMRGGLTLVFLILVTTAQEKRTSCSEEASVQVQ